MDALTSTWPAANAAKITALRAGTIDHADLYRATLGSHLGRLPSPCLHVGRVYRHTGPDEFKISGPDGDTAAGYAAWDPARGAWAITREHDGTLSLEGHASSLAIGCDVLINGVTAATGHHADRRTFGGTWHPVPATNGARHG